MKASSSPIAATVFALLIASASSVFSGTVWPQYGFDAAHSSFNPNVTLLTRDNVSELRPSAVAKLGKPSPTAPVLADDKIFVAADGKIFAFDAKTGAKVWSHLSCSGEGTVQPAVNKHRLFVADGGGDLAAYDTATGAQIWCDDEGGSITSAPAVDAGTVYITNGGDVVAVNQRNGFQHWRFTPNDFSPLTNTPAIADGIVVVTGGDSVFALDAQNGQEIWRTDLGLQDNISAPSISNGLVYVGGTELYALSESDGHIVWKNPAVGVNVTTPAIADNKVYVNSEDPEFGLHAFDAATGTLLWGGGIAGESVSTVTVANGVVYDLDEMGELEMLNSDTGAFIAKLKDPNGQPFANTFGAQVAVANGAIFVSAGGPNADGRVDIFQLP
jgi:outer membrane protein assembly factor BamB